MNNKTLYTVKCDKSSCKPFEIPTDDEVRALNALREIKGRVRKLKEIILSESEGDSFSSEKIQVESELLKLKKEWKEWERKRESAEKERMIALGHVKQGS